MLVAFMATVLVVVGLFVTFGIWAIGKWRGPWRIAVAVVGAAYCFVIGRIVIDISLNPYSHNMWPFEILIWSVYGLIALGALAAARQFAQRPAAS